MPYKCDKYLSDSCPDIPQECNGRFYMTDGIYIHCEKMTDEEEAEFMDDLYGIPDDQIDCDVCECKDICYGYNYDGCLVVDIDHLSETGEKTYELKDLDRYIELEKIPDASPHYDYSSEGYFTVECDCKEKCNCRCSKCEHELECIKDDTKGDCYIDKLHDDSILRSLSPKSENDSFWD